MAKKTNKTAHVLNLISPARSEESIQPEAKAAPEPYLQMSPFDETAFNTMLNEENLLAQPKVKIMPAKSPLFEDAVPRSKQESIEDVLHLSENTEELSDLIKDNLEKAFEQAIAPKEEPSPIVRVAPKMHPASAPAAQEPMVLQPKETSFFTVRPEPITSEVFSPDPFTEVTSPAADKTPELSLEDLLADKIAALAANNEPPMPESIIQPYMPPAQPEPIPVQPKPMQPEPVVKPSASAEEPQPMVWPVMQMQPVVTTPAPPVPEPVTAPPAPPVQPEPAAVPPASPMQPEPVAVPPAPPAQPKTVAAPPASPVQPEPVAVPPAPSVQPEPQPASSFNPLADLQELELSTEPNYYQCMNVYEQIVKNLAPEYVERFNVCSCNRCLMDVIALTLTNLPAKYIIVDDAKSTPLIDYYTRKFQSHVMTELTKACFVVQEFPRH